LKCCLNYELDTYLTALKEIPTVEKPLLTEAGPAKLQKTDIFRKLMWFSYNDDNNWHSIDAERVKVIVEMNENGKTPFNLIQDKAFIGDSDLSKNNEDLEILDKKFAHTKRKKKRKPKNRPTSANSQEQEVQQPTENNEANNPNPANQNPRNTKNTRNKRRNNKNQPQNQNTSQNPTPSKGPNSKSQSSNRNNKRRKPTRNKGPQSGNKGGNKNEG